MVSAGWGQEGQSASSIDHTEDHIHGCHNCSGVWREEGAPFLPLPCLCSKLTPRPRPFPPSVPSQAPGECLLHHPHLPSISGGSGCGELPAQGRLTSSVHTLWLCLPASPVPRIKWRKVDGSLSPQWATAEPTLQIPSVSFEDEGTYECEAENSKGRDSVQGRIIVQGTRASLPACTLASHGGSPSKSQGGAWEAPCLSLRLQDCPGGGDRRG